MGDIPVDTPDDIGEEGCDCETFADTLRHAADDFEEIEEEAGVTFRLGAIVATMQDNETGGFPAPALVARAGESTDMDNMGFDEVVEMIENYNEGLGTASFDIGLDGGHESINVEDIGGFPGGFPGL